MTFDTAQQEPWRDVDQNVRRVEHGDRDGGVHVLPVAAVAQIAHVGLHQDRDVQVEVRGRVAALHGHPDTASVKELDGEIQLAGQGRDRQRGSGSKIMSKSTPVANGPLMVSSTTRTEGTNFGVVSNPPGCLLANAAPGESGRTASAVPSGPWSLGSGTTPSPPGSGAP